MIFELVTCSEMGKQLLVVSTFWIMFYALHLMLNKDLWDVMCHWLIVCFLSHSVIHLEPKKKNLISYDVIAVLDPLTAGT